VADGKMGPWPIQDVFGLVDVAIEFPPCPVAIHKAALGSYKIRYPVLENTVYPNPVHVFPFVVEYATVFGPPPTATHKLFEYAILCAFIALPRPFQKIPS